MPMPSPAKEQWLGGHAVCVIGYDDSTRMFKMRNSWGTSWGKSGNFRMSYDIAASIRGHGLVEFPMYGKVDRMARLTIKSG